MSECLFVEGTDRRSSYIDSCSQLLGYPVHHLPVPLQLRHGLRVTQSPGRGLRTTVAVPQSSFRPDDKMVEFRYSSGTFPSAAAGGGRHFLPKGPRRCAQLAAAIGASGSVCPYSTIGRFYQDSPSASRFADRRYGLPMFTGGRGGGGDGGGDGVGGCGGRDMFRPKVGRFESDEIAAAMAARRRYDDVGTTNIGRYSQSFTSLQDYNNANRYSQLPPSPSSSVIMTSNGKPRDRSFSNTVSADRLGLYGGGTLPADRLVSCSHTLPSGRLDSCNDKLPTDRLLSGVGGEAYNTYGSLKQQQSNPTEKRKLVNCDVTDTVV